LADPLNRSNF